MAELWAPFVHDVAGAEPKIRIEINRNEEGWLLRTGAGQPQQTFDPWVLTLDLRTTIDELVVGSVPDAVDLHAAMARVGDDAVLFPGDPGAGKTTLLLAGLERGWLMLCDDLSLLDLHTARIVPMPRPIGVRSGVSLERFAHIWTPPDWLPAPTSPYLLPASAFPVAAVGAPVAPTGIVFPRFDASAATGSTRLGRAELIARLGRHIAPLTPETVTALNLLTDPAAGLDLTYSDPARGAEEVEAVVSEAGR